MRRRSTCRFIFDRFLFDAVPNQHGQSCVWLLSMLALCCVSSASAATFTVTNTNDAGAGSLRQAVLDANGSGGADDIAFSIGSGAQSIVLTSGQLSITDDLTIDGTTQPGYADAILITISGSDLSRVFEVQAATTVSLEALDITGGDSSTNDGGGISNAGVLDLTDCRLRDNTSRGNGAGLFNDGTLTLTGCEVSGNVGQLAGANGGGIYSNSGTVALTNCTVSENTAFASGGGLHLASGNVDLTNCTFSDNTASTGGGVYENAATVTLSNTIVANNAATGPSTLGPDFFGDFTDAGYNIIEDDSDSSGVVAGTSMTGDPGIDLLADNGGPTQTHALLLGSSAINNGDCDGGSVTTDQRGIVSRPFGAGCDIGAFELAYTDLEVTQSSDLSLIEPGETITYTITVTNNGPSPTSGATLTDAFYSGLESVSFTSSVTGSAARNPSSGSGNLSATLTMPINSTVTYTVTATLKSDYAFNTLGNTTSVAPPAGLLDLTTGNDSASTSVPVDRDGDGVANTSDGCPDDAAKTSPGPCGCGNVEVHSDGDGTPDCNDGCPLDSNKLAPGDCGCGVADTDSDGDGVADCNDNCVDDANADQADNDGDGIGNACDETPNGPVADTDGDGTPDASDGCPLDGNKTAPGLCGCGVADTDTDGDGIPDCFDNCSLVANTDQADADNDGTGDVCDATPNGDGDGGTGNPDPNNSGGEPNTPVTPTPVAAPGLCGFTSLMLLAAPMWGVVWSRRRGKE